MRTMLRRKAVWRSSHEAIAMLLLAALVAASCSPAAFAHDDDATPHACDPLGPFGLPGVSGSPDQIGQWSAVFDAPIYAIHQIVLHTGKVLMFDKTALGGTASPTYLLDPTTDVLTPSPLGVTSEIFCSSHTFLEDGRVLVVGGTEPDDWNVRTHIFDPVTESWTRVADMALSRYYPTTTTLPDGRVLATSGMDFTSFMRQEKSELYDPATNVWTLLPGQENGMGALPWYPMMHVVPDKRVFYAGPSQNTQMIDPYLDTRVNFGRSNFVSAGGSTAMYRPGKLLKAGGYVSGAGGLVAHVLAEVIDFSDSTPAWRLVASLNQARAWVDLVLLPDGDVLAIGGATNSGWENECAVYSAEIWDPNTETFTTVASGARPRMYHSTAALLPDGRVLVGGGENTQEVRERNYEYYSPPYLFKGARPTITSAPAAIAFGATFTVASPGSASIASVALMRPSSVTHSTNMSQGFVPLTFQDNGGTLEITAPSDAGPTPPGYYMLFLVNAAGVPSIAEFVHLGFAPTIPALSIWGLLTLAVGLMLLTAWIWSRRAPSHRSRP